VFTDAPINGGAPSGNVWDTYTNAGDDLVNPTAAPGNGLDLSPLAGALTGTATSTTGLTGFRDWDRDFNRTPYDLTFRGAYSGEGTNPGWSLALDLKPDLSGPGLSASDASVSESDGVASFVLSLSEVAAGIVTVDYATAAGTAVAGSDFTATSGTLSLAPGELSATVAVAILDDERDEADEAFTLRLSNASGGGLLDGTAQATITDDDPPPTLAIDDAQAVEGAGGSANLAFRVTLTPPSGRTVNVSFSTANGTAAAASDYTATSGTLTFAPGSSARTVRVPVVGDARIEADETFTVTLTAPVNGTLADGSATGTIANDDVGGTVQWSAARYSVSERGPAARITVTRTGGSGAGVRVDFATTNGSALAGSDYRARTGSLTFGAGVTSRTFAISIIDDAVAREGAETVALSLTNVVNGAMGARATALLSIIDNEPATTFYLPNTAYRVGESAGSLTITVQRSGSTAAAGRVSYATSDGTAAAGADYTARSGTLTFAAGVASRTFSVPIAADIDVEGDETFAFALSAPVGGTLGTQRSATATIGDDD
jgi:chitinase